MIAPALGLILCYLLGHRAAPCTSDYAPLGLLKLRWMIKLPFKSMKQIAAYCALNIKKARKVLH
jgi:hypothetical protein